MATDQTIRQIAQRLKEFRTRTGLQPEELDERLILGPGWVSSFESGETVPKLDTLLALLRHLKVDPSDFFRGITLPSSGAVIERELRAVPDGPDLLVHFKYAEYDAVYRLTDATLDQFQSFLQELRDGLAPLAGTGTSTAQAVKTSAVAGAFLKAVRSWPEANPSDIWWFIAYRAYCDPFNHPAKHARLDLAQSWKRTGGWALEEVLTRFYGSFLQAKGVSMSVARGERKARLLGQLSVAERLEPDKVDVVLSGILDGQELCFGVIHVKSSFAERRTDDVPLSRTLVAAGYTSPLWTMDCKSMPGRNPVNKGELGIALEIGNDRRSAKRKDIEDDGYFSACFSYNSRTLPTPPTQHAKARIVVCDFKDPDDAFSAFIVSRWREFRRQVAEAGDRKRP